MKITDIKTIHMTGEWRNWSFVKVETDEGIHGWGEGTLEWREKALEGSVADLARYLIGKDPRQIERHCRTIYRDGYWQNDLTLQSALSAVEMAMWDILGKSLRKPVHELLGGAVRDRVRVYANGWFFGAKTPEGFARMAKETVNKGYTALKWDPFGKADLAIKQVEAELAVECVRAVREAVGARIDLLIEVHGRLNVPSAIEMAHRLAPFGIYFYEEPVPSENIDAMAEVQRAVPVMVATGERFCTPFQFRELLEKRAARIVQPDITHIGGISGLRKIAVLADTWYVPVAPHSPNGPISVGATLQVAACTPNFLILEFLVDDIPIRNDVATESLRIEDGYVYIPKGPGLGVDLKEKALAKYPWRPLGQALFD